MNIQQTNASGAPRPPAETTAAAPRPAGIAGAESTPNATAPTAAKPASGAPVDADDLKNSVEAINRFLKVNSEVQFSIDQNSGVSVIKVIDTESHKVLRQFPSQQALDIGQDIKGLPKGLLVDNQA